MELVIKSAALALVALVLAVFLHRYSPQMALLTALCACALLLFWLIPQLSALVRRRGTWRPRPDFHRRIAASLQGDGSGSLHPADSGTVPDNGNRALAAQVELCGAVCGLLCALPLIEQALELVGVL